MRWQSFTHRGATYDLSHLDSFEWHYSIDASDKRPECTYKFHVSFSMHCFTRKHLGGEMIEDSLWYEGPKERRVFCFNRYALSRRLPAIVKNMGDRACWHTRHGNFFTIELTTMEGKDIEYEVYFDVTKATRKGWLNLIVQSAYERTEGYVTTQPKKRKIRLAVIAYNRQRGKKINPGR